MKLFCMDPSTDDTENVLINCKEKYKNIRIIKLSRRFGQSLSIKQDYITVIPIL